MTGAADLRRTPLDAVHRALGARMVPFAGFEMPVRYTSELEEHRAVRNGVGVFDLSHMGEVGLSGTDALAFARDALVSDPGTLEPGQAQYSMVCAPDGGIIDDLIVYRTDPGYLVVCNASNREAVVAHLHELAAGGNHDVHIEDRSDGTALIAPQGPRSAEVVGGLTDLDLGELGTYRSMRGRVAGIECLVARTGYTGEDGFELFCDVSQAVALWSAVMTAGEPMGIQAAGLASRDTLRLEAGMPLYGNELGLDVNPYEANLGRVVKLDKGEFVGRDALAAVEAAGPARRLVGLVMTDEGIARHGYPVMDPSVGGGSEPVGAITSGSVSPTFGTRIAMAFVPAASAAVGRGWEVMIRDRPCRAEQVQLPFYRRPRPPQ